MMAEAKPQNADPAAEKEAEGQETTQSDQKAPEAAPKASPETGKAKPNETKPDEGKGKEKETDWRAAIEDKKVRDFAGRFASPQDIARTAFEQRQKISNSVQVPGKDASEEQVKEFREKIGVPDAPEKYELKVPDDAPDALKELDDAAQERLDGLKKVLHENNIPAKSAQPIVDYYYNIIGQQMAAQEAEQTKTAEAAKDELRKEYGSDFDTNVEHAVRAMKAFGGDKAKEWIENTVIDGVKAGDHPMLVRIFANVGRRMGEDTLHMGMDGEEKKTLEQQRRDLTRKMLDAYNRGDRSEARKIQDERDKVSGNLYGTAPIVGTQGRTV